MWIDAMDEEVERERNKIRPMAIFRLIPTFLYSQARCRANLDPLSFVRLEFRSSCVASVLHLERKSGKETREQKARKKSIVRYDHRSDRRKNSPEAASAVARRGRRGAAVVGSVWR